MGGFLLVGLAACGGAETAAPVTATAVNPVVMWEGNAARLVGSYDSNSETLSLTEATRTAFAEMSVTLVINETRAPVDPSAKLALSEGATLDVVDVDGSSLALLVVENPSFIAELSEAEASTSFPIITGCDN
ncbi:MAG: hypothetical protein IPG45_27200 [Deltaproteobacteria bacterium]|nr:hypothetical protein [Deltaproteobacteria bacterium]